MQRGDFDLNDFSSLTYELVRLSEAGSSDVVATFPNPSVPNGITFDEAGILYAADSGFGKVWRIDVGTGEVESWLESDLLAPQGPQGIPGANGLKFFGPDLFVVNSSSGDFVRVPVNEDGSASEPEVVTSGVTGDDFAFDPDGNAFITTHPFNTVLKVAPDGSKTVVGNAENGIIGPTAAAFGVAGDETGLYVVTDGGLFLQMAPPELGTLLPQDQGLPSVVRLELATSYE